MKILFTIGLMTFSVIMSAQETLAGSWNTGKDNTIVEVAETEGVYAGKILSSDSKSAKIGNTILKEIVAAGDIWKGKMYSPKKDDWFDAELELKGEELVVTVSNGKRSRTLKWTKA